MNMIIQILWRVIWFVVKILLGYICADFIIGVYHWIKDTYFGPFTPIIGKKLIWGSRLHHIRPKYVTEISDLELLKGSTIWTLFWMGPLFLIRGINSFNLTMFLMIIINDVVHKYTHFKEKERPYWATKLQKLGIFQSYDEHHLHHSLPFEVNYCPITPYVNTLLEKVNFWRKLETYIEKYTGVKPREKEYDFVEDESYPAGVKFIQ